ncbi:rna-directed dna polymerase from mobile element jockey-like [Limosa lapponica baueri]|uniref:Rna-directed dna polymerase from mobile element jockey-like n=1 Tax=Limosa lapponica baueri TaxID=1758121 RepID=A0A2I0U3J8_LIMLA|nr:rna-directed dna polymerase from mobile element jockey-like [Limosa lapponica baueri]
MRRSGTTLYERNPSSWSSEIDLPYLLVLGSFPNEGRAVGIVYPYFSKAFYVVSCKIFIEKLTKHRLDEQTARWTENWLSGHSQRVVIGGLKFSWRSVTSGVPQGSLLRLVLFNIFINHLDDGTEHTLSKVVENTKVGGVADMPECHTTIQRVFNSLE